ncbi:unnamed protein product [Urochloa humidicola]
MDPREYWRRMCCGMRQPATHVPMSYFTSHGGHVVGEENAVRSKLVVFSDISEWTCTTLWVRKELVLS